MTLVEVAAEAVKIFEAHEEGASMDAGFDAGEFSGPAHSRMLQSEIEAIAKPNGFTFSQVMFEIEYGADNVED